MPQKSATKRGDKTFELRENDRDFQVGDKIILLKIGNYLLGESELGPFTISYVLHGGKFGLGNNYCILQLSK
jgi:hypothetical protein